MRGRARLSNGPIRPHPLATMVHLTGTPVVLDQALRPLARAVALSLGLVPSLLLLWAGFPEWAPLPLVTTFVVYQLGFWWRGDRPIALRLDRDRLSCVDPRGGHHVEVPLLEIHAATLLVRPTAHVDRCEAVLVLADDARIRFAVRLLVEPGLHLHQEDVRADVMEALLGGTGGLRGLAPTSVTCRQIVDDPAGQAILFLREHLPASVWERTAVRVWSGAEPELDAFGVHVGEPDGLLVLDGDQWRLRDGRRTRSGTVTLIRSGRASRPFRRARRVDPRDVERGSVPLEEVELPLLLLDLDEQLTVAFPAPTAGRRGDERPPDPTWLHAHTPEGAALVWHVLTRWPEAAWPVALRSAAPELLATAAAPRPASRAASTRSRSPSRGR